MPLPRISLRQGKSAAYKQVIMMEVYTAMHETFGARSQTQGEDNAGLLHRGTHHY